MPIYEYLCQDCAYTFEVRQSMKDEPVAVCARCGKSVQRIISAPAIMFKGSGWYVTDYSDKLKPPSGDSSAPEASKKEAKDGAGAPAAAPAPASTPAATAPTPSTGGTPPAASTSSSTSSGGTSSST